MAAPTGYKIKYSLIFTSITGNGLELYIYQKGWSGGESTMIGAADPLIFSYDKNGDDFFEPLKPTSLTINIISTLDQYEEFEDITERLYFVELIDSGSTFSWSGYLNDEIFQQEYKDGSFMISLTATDCLALLKNKQIESTGRVSLMALVVECLDHVGLDYQIIDAINIYEDSMDTGKGVLEQTYFDASQFTKDGTERWKLDDVLREILSTFGAKICISAGEWVITNIESIYDTITGYRYFSNGTIDPENPNYSYSVQKTLSSTTNDATHVILLTGGRKEKRKGWKECSVLMNLGKKAGSIAIPNGDFEIASKVFKMYQAADYGDWNIQNWQLDPVTGVRGYEMQIASHQLTNNYLWLWNNGGLISYDYYVWSVLSDAPFIPEDLVNSYFFSLDYAIIGTSPTSSFSHYFEFQVICHKADTSKMYLTEAGAWTGDETTIRSKSQNYRAQESFKWINKKITFVGFPGGRLQVILIHKTKGGLFRGVAIDNVMMSCDQMAEAPETVKYTKTINTDLSTTPETKEFQMCDIISDYTAFVALNYKNYISLSDGIPTSSWQSANFPESGGSAGQATLAGIYLEIISTLHQRGLRQNTITIKGAIAPNMIIIDEKGRKFMIISFSGSLKTNTFSCEILEFINPSTRVPYQSSGEGSVKQTWNPSEIADLVRQQVEEIKDRIKKITLFWR